MSGRARPRIVVAAAVVQRGSTFLVTRRPRGVHLEGYWEFPGGKCEPGEAHEACLRREIVEELGVAIRIGPQIFEVAHDYPDRTVELHFFECRLADEPVPLLGQEVLWVEREDLGRLDFPPADAELIGLLQGRAGSA